MNRHVYYYTVLVSGFSRALDLLQSAPALWLPAPAEQAGPYWRVALNAAGALPPPVAGHLAEVRLGDVSIDDTLAVPITWHSARSDRLLPTLDGHLELAPLDGDGAHLSLLGSYRPPLSVVGGAGDRLLGHRIAEACVRQFVLDVASRLEVVPISA